MPAAALIAREILPWAACKDICTEFLGFAFGADEHAGEPRRMAFANRHCGDLPSRRMEYGVQLRRPYDADVRSPVFSGEDRG